MKQLVMGVMLFCAVSCLGQVVYGQEAKMETVDVVKVMTDRYVDTTSLEGIVNGIVKDGMSEQEKIIAFYHWYRRLIYHHRYMSSNRRGVLDSINSYGYNLCGSQAAVLVMILNKAGFKTRVVMADAGKGFGGHTFVEAQYDGGWHAFDTMTSFMVFNRKTPPQIASLEELAKDPTLVTKAVEENRVPKGFLVCMNNPDVTVDDIAAMEKKGIKRDRRWATLTFEGGSLLDFWTKGPQKRSVLSTGTYSGYYYPGVLDITLKPNEEYVRLWDNVGMWLSGPSYRAYGPHHTCGSVDQHDTENFKFFEPYGKKGVGMTKICYRYYGNGWLEWKPDSAAGEIEPFCGEIKNLVRKGSFFTSTSDGASMMIPVKSPYSIVQVEVDIEFKGTGSHKFNLDMLIANKKNKRMLKPREMKEKKGNDGITKLVYREKSRAALNYEFRVTVGKGVSFRIARIKTTFQLNMYSLPGFYPGKNTVTVSGKTAGKLDKNRLYVTYEWNEGDNWTVPKSITKEFTTIPATYDVEVAGPKMPRMKKLIIKLAKPGNK